MGIHPRAIAMIKLQSMKIAGIEIPQTDLVSRSLAYVNEHNAPAIAHHAIRSAIFALIIRNKIPTFANLHPEDVAVAVILHDLGLSEDAHIVSKDKRFEVDGAIAAKSFVSAEAEALGQPWDEHRLQELWYSIALHSTPSIAFHSQPLAHITCWGITADFMGPLTPGGVITVEEYKEVLKAYPRIGFQEVLTSRLCGLCRDKPDTTFDNFVADFGCGRVEGYEDKKEAKRLDKLFGQTLMACKQYETEGNQTETNETNGTNGANGANGANEDQTTSTEKAEKADPVINGHDKPLSHGDSKTVPKIDVQPVSSET